MSMCAWETPTTWNTIFIFLCFFYSGHLGVVLLQSWIWIWVLKQYRHKTTYIPHTHCVNLLPALRMRQIVHMYLTWFRNLVWVGQLACFKALLWVFLSSFSSSVSSFRSPSWQSKNDKNITLTYRLHSSDWSRQRSHKTSGCVLCYLASRCQLENPRRLQRCLVGPQTPVVQSLCTS